MAIQQEKRRLRKKYREMRRALGDEYILEASQGIAQRLLALPGFAGAGAVFTFVSMKGEPQTAEIIGRLFAAGVDVIVPRCRNNGLMDLVKISGMGDLAPGTMGILEPVPGLPQCTAGDIDFAVVPALACGEDGSRLGQGGGYYDRFLEAYTGDYAAICFELFVCKSLPTQQHDKPVKRIITEKRVIE